MSRTRVLVAATTALLAACSSSARRSDRVTLGDYGYARAHLGRMVREAMAKHGVKGVSLALVDDQQVVMAEGFGFADVARGVPATAETLYRVGSISKLFTAVEVVRLAEQRRVDLDRDIAEYVPGFGMRSRFPPLPITLRALLAHHGGLPSDLLRGMWIDKPHRLSELVEDLHEESLASAPQTQFKYSNIGYSLLGRAVEATLSRPFADAMRDELLLPMGMARSSFEPLPSFSNEVSKGYARGAEIPPYGLRDEPAGSLLSSTRDMARFLRVIFAGGRAGDTQIMSEATLDEMFRPQFPDLPLDFGHREGLGFNLSGIWASGRPVAWHMGGYPPFFVIVALLREEKLGVVMLANSHEAGKFAQEIAVKALELGLEAKLGIAPHPPVRPPRPAFDAAHAATAQFAGRYVVQGQLTNVADSGGHLKVQFAGTDLDLVPIAADRFMPEKRVFFGLFKFSLAPMEIEFTRVADRSVAVVRGFPMPIPCERVEPGPIPEPWRARLGAYAAEDLSGERFTIRDLRVEEDLGVLVARVRVSGTMPSDPAVEVRLALRPVSDDEAVVTGLGTGEGATVRALHGPAGTLLRYSGFTFVAASR